MAERSLNRKWKCRGVTVAASVVMLFGWVSIFYAQSSETEMTPPLETHTQKTAAHLYFSDHTQSFLSAETRVIVHTDPVVDFAKQIIAALIRGPQSGLIQTLPANCRLRTFFLMPDGIAFADFDGNLPSLHPGGCQAEILTVYSITNSLVLNVPEIDAVKILIDGEPAPTLAGHVDIRHPLKADMLLIR